MCSLSSVLNLLFELENDVLWFEYLVFFSSYHISNGRMCISNQCKDVNPHLAILSDECCTQVV